MARLLSSIFLILALTVAALPAWGQAEDTEPVPAESEEGGSVETPADDSAAPEPAPTASLARSIEDANAALRDLGNEVAAENASVNIAGALPALVRTVDELSVQQEDLNLGTLSLHRLDLMHQQWTRSGAKLEEWQETLDRRSNDLSQADQTLDKMRQRWETIATSAEESGMPEELLAQVRTVQSSIDEVDQRIAERLSVVLVLLGRVTETRTTATQADIEVEQAKVLARKRILAPDSPTLWEALAHPGERISLSQQWRETWNEDSRQFRIFMNVYRQRVPLQVFFFLVASLLMLFVWLRIRNREVGEDDRALETAKLIFSRPFSAALMLTLASSRLYYPQAPIIVYDINMLLALIPVLRLVPRLSPPGLRPIVYAMSGLFALAQFHALMSDDTLLQRLILLIATSIGLAGAIWLSRREGPASTYDGGRWWKAAVVGFRIAAVLLAWAILSNLIGSVALAELLAEATLSSAFGGVCLTVCAVVLESLATMLLRSDWARATGMVSRHSDVIVRRTSSVIRLVIFAAWLAGTLNLFRLLEITIELVSAALNKTWTFGNLTVSIGSVLAFVLTILVSVYLSRFIRFVLDEDVFPRLPLQRGVPATLSMLINYSILTLGFLSAMAVAGIEVSQFAIIFGALGVGIGFGLQNIVNNFISGLILVFERPVKIGDTIEVGTMIGEVRRIGIRASTVRTFDGAEVIVPNGNLISAEVINWTLSDRIRRIKVAAGVAYGTDPQKVIDILIKVAKESDDILGFPEPNALFKGFGASSLDFELRAWTANFDRWMRVASQITVDVNRELVEAGIEIPFPQRDLHLRSVEPSAGRALSGAQGPEASPEER